jgi:hypothetical protein
VTLQPFCVDEYFVKKTLSATPKPLYRWKAENLSFLYDISLRCQTGEFVNNNVEKVGHFSQSKPWPKLLLYLMKRYGIIDNQGFFVIAIPGTITV